MHTLRTILRWLGYAVLAIIVVVIIGLGYVRIAAAIHESKTSEQAAPATGHFVQTEGGKIFVQETGPVDGPAVIFIHGTGAWSEIWRPQMEAIAKAGFHAIAIDLPPFGFSEKPADATYSSDAQARRIIGVIDGLKIGNITLVGHSFGGKATMEAAFLLGNRVSSLILIDVALGLSGAPSQPSALLKAVMSNRFTRNVFVSATATNPWMTRTLINGLIADPATLTAAQVTMLQQPFVVEQATDAFGEWLIPFLFTTETTLSSQHPRYLDLTIPVLLLWGEKDTVTPVVQGEYLHTLIRDSELKILPGIGHIPALENPERVNRVIVDFLTAHRSQL